MKIQPFQFNPFAELTYLVWDPSTRQGAVIDPGMSSKDEQQFFDSFTSSNGIKLKYLLYTHLHIDHTFGHEHIVEAYQLKCMANPADAFLGEARAQQAIMFNLGIPSPNELKIDIPLTDGQILTLGEETLRVISVPGHSPGSVAYYCEESGFVLSGDALFNGSIGRTDLPGGNHNQLINSIRSQLLTLPPETKVYPGHGPTTTIGEESTYNPYL